MKKINGGNVTYLPTYTEDNAKIVTIWETCNFRKQR